ncbi:oocyte zinc finger protein XLCOF14 [Culex quinquefasciatus]|uniref:Oocyte zinc finger protein XLCOF14 n=1 Tax=Culex quinquefasciatus TaxID=7176 RepID=B0W4Y9_CULQU|nr:oocyte zinc finger protein XLCOF14 [Culex quinquefasciatus]|eukprot:XP_001843773.1 oocyte zinc finger protein XLCOF14 [Culex quinquefasciatus]
MEPTSNHESLHNITIKEEEIKSEPSDEEGNSDAFGSQNPESDTASERDIFEDIDNENEQSSEINVEQTRPKVKRKSNPAVRRKSYAKNPRPANFACETCGRTFSYQYHLKAHRAKEHGDGVVPVPNRIRAHFCKHCERNFSVWKTLVCHLEKAHGEQIDETKFVRCTSCHRKFVSADDLRVHSCMKGSHVGKDRRFACDLCEKTYVSAHGLERHRSAHPEHQKTSCDECGKPFASEKELQQHKKRVHVKPSHVCEICNKAFKGLPHLRIHAQIHQEQKAFCCEFCGKSFAQRNGMTAHVRIYHAEQVGEDAVAEREITCEICAKKLKGKRSYKLHMKVHDTSERKFPCSFCDTKFITKQDLVRHEQRHTKQFQFRCRFCGKGSTRRRQITLHEARIHNWPAPFDVNLLQHKCGECGRGFGSKSALKTHETLHGDGLPVPCKMCDKRFKNVKYMTYHMKMHHADGSPTMKPRKKRAKVRAAVVVAEETQEEVEFKAIEIHENPLPPLEEEDEGGETSGDGSTMVSTTLQVKSETS